MRAFLEIVVMLVYGVVGSVLLATAAWHVLPRAVVANLAP